MSLPHGMIALTLALAGTLVFLGTANACTTETDCHLNGVCIQGGSCVCDPAWTGPDCSLLNLLPAPCHVSFQGAPSNVASWGASIHPVPDASPSYYVMYASEFAKGCGLQSWKTNSQVVVATSNNAEGPYVRRSVAVPPWSHNPEAIRIPKAGINGKGIWAIFSLGDGEPLHGDVHDCTKGTPLLRPQRQPLRLVGAAERSRRTGETIKTHVKFAIHYSENGPLGPWKSHVATIEDFPSAYDFPGNWNPAPIFLPSGRVRIMVHTNTAPWTGEVIVEAKSWRGPYKPLTEDVTSCTRCQEDPFIWVDKRKNWHALYHRMFDDGTDKPSKNPIPSPGWTGGHSFSKDGLVWSSITRAYNTTVLFTDGTQREMKRRERPKLLFDPDGSPTHLINGVQDDTYGTYTLVTPLGH